MDSAFLRDELMVQVRGWQSHGLSPDCSDQILLLKLFNDGSHECCMFEWSHQICVIHPVLDLPGNGCMDHCYVFNPNPQHDGKTYIQTRMAPV